VATNALAISGPRDSGAGEVLQHVDQADDGADDADGRRVAAHRREELGGDLVLALLGGDLTLEDGAQLLGVGAVDAHLQATLEERVVDVLDLRLEGQEPLHCAPSPPG
jgi:hypothetical protein